MSTSDDGDVVDGPDEIEELGIGIDPDSSPIERLEANLKTPYPTGNTVWSAFLEAMAAELEELETVRKQVLASKFLDTANVAQLERLATIFDLSRRTGEPVTEFRARVKTALRSQIGSGTLSEIGEMIVVLLEIDREDVELFEPEDEVALLEPRIPADVMGEAEVRPPVLNDLLGDVSAAGVKAKANFLADTGRLRLRPLSARPREMSELEEATLQLVAKDTDIAEMSELEPASIELTVDDTDVERLNERGLSSENREALSSGEWTLSEN